MENRQLRPKHGRIDSMHHIICTQHRNRLREHFRVHMCGSCKNFMQHDLTINSRATFSSERPNDSRRSFHAIPHPIIVLRFTFLFVHCMYVAYERCDQRTISIESCVVTSVRRKKVNQFKLKLNFDVLAFVSGATFCRLTQPKY